MISFAADLVCETLLQGGSKMLVLSRKEGERIVVANCIQLTVVAVTGNKVKLGFTAPADISIHRQEVQDRIQTQCRESVLATEAR